MDSWILVSACVTLIWSFYQVILYKLQYFKRCGIPYIEPEFYFGNSRGIGKLFHPSEFITKMYRELKAKGPVGGVFFYTRAVHVATDLDLVKQIMVKDFNIFTNRGLYFNERDDPISANLVNIEDDAWRSLRHKITPTFSSGKIKLMFRTVSEIADKLVDTISQEKITNDSSFEVKSVLMRYTTDVIAATAFGIESNTLKEKTNIFLEMGLKAFNPSSFFLRNFMTSNRKLGNLLGMSLGQRDVSKFYFDVVRKTVKQRKENTEVQRNDFMDLLMKLAEPSLPEPLSFNQLVAQSAVFFLAGFETTSTTLTYCLYDLSQNAELQMKVRESVKNVMKRYSDVLSYECVNEMDYLEQCVNETLRLHPPASQVQRIAKEDYKIPNTGIVIKKGSTIIIPTCAIQRDPEIYPNPDKFDPDNFSAEAVERRHQFSFLPFGQGPRICIALRFAMMEVKIALAKLLTNFEFELDRSKTSVPLKISPNRLMVMSPAEGIYIHFENLNVELIE